MTDLLNVDLTRGSVTREPLSAELESLGGHGLTSAIVDQEVDPKADPLGPGNVLVIAAGIFAGTSVPNGGRLSVGGKSPLTGGIKEANSGGSAARALAQLGLRGIKVTGRAEELSVLVVTADGGKLVAAPELQGLGSFDTVDQLWKQYGDKVSLDLHRPRRRDGREGRRRARHDARPPHARGRPRWPRLGDGLQEAQGGRHRWRRRAGRQRGRSGGAQGGLQDAREGHPLPPGHGGTGSARVCLPGQRDAVDGLSGDEELLRGYLGERRRTSPASAWPN